jgi:diguanylate cyclase (GGDEF)-like protein
MQQLTRELNSELDRLNQATSDWAYRDDSYTFMQRPSGSFADKIAPATLEALSVNFIAMLDTQAMPVYSAAINLATGETESPAKFDGARGDVQKRLNVSAPNPERNCGLTTSFAGPSLVCWQAIRKTDLSGNPVGTLMMVRPLDAALISKLQKQGRVQFELSPLSALSSTSASAGDAAQKKSSSVNLLEPEQITFNDNEPKSVNAVLRNIAGEPVLKVRLDYTHAISSEGAGVLWNEILRMVVVTVLVGLALFACLNLLIFSRLDKMGVEMKSIWRNGRWAERLVTSKRSDEISEMGHAVNRMLGLIRKQSQALDTIAHTDSLTQIANQRAFEQRILIEMSLHKRNNAPLSLLLLDIDHFKLYNDLYGHPAGDDILIQIARLVAQVASRPSDLPARISEEEFAVILPSTALEGAIHVAQTLKNKLATLQIPHANSPIAEFLTLSIGVTAAGDEDLAALMHRIELAHTKARETGRNKICALPATENSVPVPDSA